MKSPTPQHLVGFLVTDNRSRNQGIDVDARIESDTLTAEQRRKLHHGMAALIAQTLAE